MNGCYSLRLASGRELGPFRMQATALAQYLLYGRAHDFLAAGLTTSATPASRTVWRVAGHFTITNLGTGERHAVKFVPASGCAAYPEAQVDASGTPFSGSSPEAAVTGTLESHAHITAFEFFGGDWHCGAPWSPFGAPYALPASCAPDQQGTNGEFEAFVDFGGPTRPSDMHGWPTFVEWPSPTALAEEGDYWTGVERAWKAGLRLMVTNLVDNEALCTVMTKRHNPCNDMASVLIQDRDLHKLQDYIDAQSGGPGKGWFRLVTDPFQARRVINAGKLAVIEGVEVSRIFGCGESNNVPQCGTGQIDAGLKLIHRLGVRTFFPIHEFNNAFGGTKMIAGEQGAIVNAGNRYETGSFWTLKSCPAKDQDAQQLTFPATGVLAQLLNGPVASLTGGNPLPIYQSGPQCNVRGITNLGRYVIGQMIKQRFIIQTDHMSSKTATAAVAIAEQQHYPGVVSAHCCSSPQLFARIYRLGGFVDPPVQPASSFVTQWRNDKALRAARYPFGFGWGSDENGLGDQPGPSAATPIKYPFKSFDGRVTFTREQWGQRTFDLNKDGLANYGMYADWLAELQRVGGTQVMSDMFRGAEAYLEMWERAYGVPATSCLPSAAAAGTSGFGALRLGASYKTLLYGGGQPVSRQGRSYRYCVAGSQGAPAAVVFDRAGRAVLVLSSADGYRAGGLAVGMPAKGRQSGISLGRRLAGGGRFVYGVSGGRIRFVGVASRTAASSSRTLAADVRAAGG